jgi:predicted nucleotide-binding protein
MGSVGGRVGQSSSVGRSGETSSEPPRKKRRQYRVFIRHSSADTWMAQVIGEKIGNLGAAVWLDAKDLSGGDFVLQEVLKAVHECDEAVVLVTPFSVSSQWITVEIGAFLGQAKRVTPLLNHVDHQAISPIQGVKAIDLNDLQRFLTELKKRLGRTRAGRE